MEIKALLWIFQGIIFFFVTESYLRENAKWNIVYIYLEKGIDSFINWRANANILEEMKLIPKVFSWIGIISFCIFLLLYSIDFFKTSYVIHFFVVLFLLAFIVNFSFYWVFNHKKVINDLKPMLYIYGLVIFVLIVVTFFVGIYPPDMITFFHKNHMQIPSEFQLLRNFIFYLFLVFLSIYILIWMFTILVPIIILVVLYVTSKISRLILQYMNKKSFIGIVGIFQIIIFVGFYKYT